MKCKRRFHDIEQAHNQLYWFVIEQAEKARAELGLVGSLRHQARDLCDAFRQRG